MQRPVKTNAIELSRVISMLQVNGVLCSISSAGTRVMGGTFDMPKSKNVMAFAV